MYKICCFILAELTSMMPLIDFLSQLVLRWELAQQFHQKQSLYTLYRYKMFYYPVSLWWIIYPTRKGDSFNCSRYLSKKTPEIIVFYFSVQSGLELILVPDQYFWFIFFWSIVFFKCLFSPTTFSISLLPYLNEGADECTWEERKRARWKVMKWEWSRDKRELLVMEVRWASL